MRAKFHTPEDNVWFTADLHFGHAAMLRPDICSRPWPDVDAMDNALITNWNSDIGARDHVFILGDVSFRKDAETISILAQLNGIKYLIRGNHDKKLSKTALSMFDGGVADYHEIDVDQQHIVMCHFAFRSWNRMHYGSWNLHGHSHGNLLPVGRQLDVGIDCIGHVRFPDSYRPVNFLSLALGDVQIVSEDHHQPKNSPTTTV